MSGCKLLLSCAAVLLLAATGQRAMGELNAPASATTAPAPQAYWVYVGNYAKGEKKGIYSFRLDAASGALTAVAGEGGTARKSEPVAEAENPNFLAVHPSGKFLYAVTSTKVGNDAGAVEAFAVDAATGKLTFLNRQASGGAEPVHVAVDPDGKLLAVANYSGASVAMLPIAADGKLAEATAVVKHEGSSVDPARQKHAFPHGVAFDGTAGRLMVADLGMDKVLIYRVNAGKGTLIANQPPAGIVAPGSGPRHLAFGKDGRFVYVVSEMSNTLTVFAYGEKGALKEVQTVSPWADVLTGKDYAAEVAVHPTGRLLYISERGKDNIAVLAIDADSGKLTLAGTFACGGKNPRHFGIDPSGKYLICANQGSDSLTVFQIDQETGGLKATDVTAATPKPVCVVFVPVK